MKLIKYILILIFLVSCKGKTNYEKPEDLIPKEQMIDLLMDMHLAIGASSVNNIYGERSDKYMFLVFDKYKIDSTRFASSNLYYTSNVDEYIRMFEEIENRLKDVQKQYEKEVDSIDEEEHDSIKYNQFSKMKKRKTPK